MQKLVLYFFSDYHFKSQTLWFKRLLYFFLIIQSVYWLFYYDLLFGSHALAYSDPKSIGIFKDLAFLVYYPGSTLLSVYCICALIVFCILNLFLKSFQFFPDLLIWLIVINLHNKIYPTLTGGNNLLNQFLFFNCFLSSSFYLGYNVRHALKIASHNFAVLAILVQMCLVYFLSGVAKLGDAHWLGGDALSYVSQIKHFSLFSFLSYSESLKPVFIFLTYFVLVYQLFFPVFVWIKKVKKPLLLLGILMHLYIAFVMGLVAFGWIMILAYVFFWPSKQEIS